MPCPGFRPFQNFKLFDCSCVSLKTAWLSESLLIRISLSGGLAITEIFNCFVVIYRVRALKSRPVCGTIPEGIHSRWAIINRR
jgi:hypothetical protein